MSTADIIANSVGGSALYLPAGDADAWYLSLCGTLVFFMQAGFALLEAGSVRAKNTKNILMKNLLDACIGALIWWAWGYGLAYGGYTCPSYPENGGTPPGKDYNGFMGGNDEGARLGHFFTEGYNTADSGIAYAGWWFQYVFAAAAATIVSGAMAERTALIGYLCYTLWITGFVYPVAVYWSSWTGDCGYIKGINGAMTDFAGSGIVHMTGGVAALCGAAVVGPRKGRFDESKKPIAIAPHNTTFQVLGTFILWMGWYGFNPGSTLGITGQGQTMARCCATTTLSAATGGITVVLVDKMMISKTWDVGQLCNGILGGLVSITAGTGNVYPWAAIIMGFLGGFVYLAGSKCTLFLCKVDDPLDAFAVHGACGLWGLLAVGLFASPQFGDEGLFGITGGETGKGSNGKMFVANLCYGIFDIMWVVGTSMMCFVPLKLAGLLRVSADVEDAGMDVSKHGGSAYVNN